MKKKGKSYKAREPYQLGKPVEQYSKPPKAFKILKFIFFVFIWAVGIAALALLVIKYFHFLNEHKY